MLRSVSMTMLSIIMYSKFAMSTQKPQLNDEGIYLNPNITVNKEGRYEYSSKDRGQIINGKYYQDEFREPDIFDLDKSMFTEAEHRGSHIPKEKLEKIEGYLTKLAKQCEVIYEFDNSFSEPSESNDFKLKRRIPNSKEYFYTSAFCNKPYGYTTERKPTCEKGYLDKINQIEEYFPRKLAERIHQCVPYILRKAFDKPFITNDHDPLSLVEFHNKKEAFFLLKQYEVIYLTIRANNLMGRYTRLMIPTTLLKEYADTKGFTAYFVEEYRRMEKRYPDENITFFDIADQYFGREKWQSDFATFLDKKTTELNILERNYIQDALDLTVLEKEFYQFYPRRYIPESRRIFPSWTHTNLQDEMKNTFWYLLYLYLGQLKNEQPAARHYINKGVIIDSFPLYDFTFKEHLGDHIPQTEYQKVSWQLVPLIAACSYSEGSTFSKETAEQLIHHNIRRESDKVIHFLYFPLVQCLSKIIHYQNILQTGYIYGHNRRNTYGLGLIHNLGFNMLNNYEARQAGILSTMDRRYKEKLLEQEIYPRIYLLIRHYRLLVQFPFLPIPTKFMDDYLDSKQVSGINRDNYDEIIFYLFKNQDDFAEYLDRQYQTIDNYLID